jgi:protein TonB
MRIAGKEPIYPPEAKAQKLKGVVKLQVVTDIGGNVTQVKAVSATDPIFVHAAMAAARTWRFRPYIHNGVPAAAQFIVTSSFSIGQ